MRTPDRTAPGVSAAIGESRAPESGVAHFIPLWQGQRETGGAVRSADQDHACVRDPSRGDQDGAAGRPSRE
jgi:hypothetical protein